jgi:two-component system, NarL family, response regulator NreC
MSTQILLADDHLVIREGLKALLERGGLKVVGEAADGREAVRMATQLKPDVAVLDISMPGLNGLDACRELLHSSPKTRCIVLTMHKEEQYVTDALRAGAKGYVLKTQAATELLQAIAEVCRGGVYLSPGVSRTVVDAYLTKSELPPDPLTARERQVLQLIGEGKTTKEVAVVLGVSTKTAETHRTRLMQKLDIHETAGLVRYAIRRGLVQP